MSFFIKFLIRTGKIISSRKSYKFLIKLLNLVTKSYQNSYFYKIIHKLCIYINESSIWNFVIRKKGRINFIDSSIILRNSKQVFDDNMDIVELGLNPGTFNMLFKGIQRDIMKRPVFVISLVILSATSVNTLFWLVLKEFVWSGLILRMLLIICAVLGLYIKFSLKNLTDYSIFIRLIKKEI